jgi:hypothetical protein
MKSASAAPRNRGPWSGGAPLGVEQEANRRSPARLTPSSTRGTTLSRLPMPMRLKKDVAQDQQDRSECPNPFMAVSSMPIALAGTALPTSSVCGSRRAQTPFTIELRYLDLSLPMPGQACQQISHSGEGPSKGAHPCGWLYRQLVIGKPQDNCCRIQSASAPQNAILHHGRWKSALLRPRSFS